MTGISRLIRRHLLGISTAVGLQDASALWQRRPLSNRVHFLAAFAALAALWGTPACAQSYTVYLEPIFLYNATGTPYRDTLAAAWSDVQAAFDYCNVVPAGSTCQQVQNLHPDTTGPYGFMLDGIWYWQYWDEQVCSTPTGLPTVCNTSTDVSSIQTSYVCPPNFGAGYYDTSTQNHLLACARTIPAYSQPPTKFCMSCIGNPIIASTGQKLQAETDYSGSSGLNFTRTYLSNNGYFASVLRQGFIDNSAPQGTVQQQCIPGTWTSGSQSGVYCFPYISVYPHVNGGVAQYQLQGADGRSTLFSGPNSAITQNADINDRVTQISVGGVNEWQVKREDDSTEIYSAAGTLIQKTLRGGKAFSYTYSTSSTPSNIAPYPGLLISQTDAFGHSLSWIYNSAGQMTLMTDPAGGTYQYSYDSSGNLTGVIYPDGSSKTYEYNESANTGGASLPNALTGVTDENNSRYATFQYQNSNGNTFAVNTQHAGGVDSYTFTYSAYWGSSPYRTTVVDPLGTSKTYAFANNLSFNVDSSQTQPAASGSGNVTQSEAYDANGNPATRIDFNGNTTTYVYDLTRNLETSRTEAYGTAQSRTITTTWDANWRQPDLITEPNRTTAFTYDNLGNVLTKTITDTATSTTRIWTYTYDTYGRMLTAKGPRTDVNSTTTYAYYTCTTGYQCGQVQTITDALGHITTFNTYNAHGQPLTITDPNGVVTTLSYDLRQRLLSRQIGTETTGYTYYPTGLLETVTLSDSSTITYTYDAAHRLTKITDGAGNYLSYTLDNMGNRTAENSYDPSSTLHRTHTRVFNALNELYQDINSAGTSAVTTTLAYDNDGNVLNSAAPLSRNTADQYDALNRLTQITDPASGITKLGYDANDNLASVIDPRNLTTSYTHNGFGDVTQLVSPDTGTSSNTYDSGGNLKTATDARSAVATYAYDAMNRVTQVAYADQTINFTYDAGTNGIGRLTGASDTNHTLSWTYDTLGRVTGKGQKVGTVTKSVGYAYVNGDLTSLVTPSGQTIVYAYTNHRITSITVNGTALLTNATYDPFGPATGWTWGNSTASTRSFDKDGNPSQIVTAGVTNGYTVDNASRITGLSDSGLSSNSFTFGYDLLDRVTSGTSTGKTRGYTYDANSNQLTTTGRVAFTDTIAPSSNRLSSTTGGIVRTYGYDNAGNTTGYTGDSFTFNKRGRMSQAIVNGSASNYVYNAVGQLIHKSGNGGNTLLMYDEVGHILGEYSSTGALVEETIWMGDMPVATLRPNGTSITIYYVHADHLGTPRKVTRPADNGLMWRWDPDTFGSVAPNSNPSGHGTFTYNLRFPGQYALTESGLYYNYFRTFDPQMGRYIESDPIGLAGGSPSTYGYAGNNPTSNVDPNGLLKRGFGFVDPDWQAIQDAEEKIRQELKKSCSCHENSADDSCIPCDKVDLLLNRLDTSVVYFVPDLRDPIHGPNICAKGAYLGYTVKIGPNAFNPTQCHCLAATLYHEVLHNTGEDDDTDRRSGAGTLEKRCMSHLCK
jgi:RHS repeat-associated protein